MNKQQKKAAAAAKGATTENASKRNTRKPNNESAAPVKEPQEVITPEPAAPVIPTEPAANEPASQDVIVDTLVEKKEEPSQENLPDPVEEALKLIADRPVTVFWHKRCAEGKTTKTTLYAKETLRLTDGKVTVPNPLYKDAETTPDVPQTIEKPVYSLKRQKRIYYLHDVNELDIVKASRAKAAEDAAKKAEQDAKDALKS